MQKDHTLIFLELKCINFPMRKKKPDNSFAVKTKKGVCTAT